MTTKKRPPIRLSQKRLRKLDFLARYNDCSSVEDYLNKIIDDNYSVEKTIEREDAERWARIPPRPRPWLIGFGPTTVSGDTIAIFECQPSFPVPHTWSWLRVNPSEGTDALEVLWLKLRPHPSGAAPPRDAFPLRDYNGEIMLKDYRDKPVPVRAFFGHRPLGIDLGIPTIQSTGTLRLAIRNTSDKDAVFSALLEGHEGPRWPPLPAIPAPTVIDPDGTMRSETPGRVKPTG